MRTRDKYVEEIMLCFEKQYEKDWERYECFFENQSPFKSQSLLSKNVLTYCDMLEDFNFLVSIIKELMEDA